MNTSSETNSQAQSQMSDKPTIEASSFFNPLWNAMEAIMEIREINSKFQSACSQMILLDNQIHDAEVRYFRAIREKRKSFCYTLRMKLATLDNIRGMFFQYASTEWDRMEQLQLRFVEQTGLDEWTDELLGPDVDQLYDIEDFNLDRGQLMDDSTSDDDMDDDEADDEEEEIGVIEVLL